MNDVKFIISIDEEGLLPGTPESRETHGFLPISFEQTPSTTVKFLPLVEQQALLDLNLKSKGADLFYISSHGDQILKATAGAHGAEIFTLQLHNDGAYTLTLHNQIDRLSPANLVSLNDLGVKGIGNVIETSTHNQMSLFQDITTEPGKPYQLTFYYHPQSHPITAQEQVDVYWGGQLLHTIDPHQTAGKGYSFSVEGDLGNDFTTLQFIGVGINDPVSHYLDHISVVSTSLIELPMDIGFLVNQGDNEISRGFLTVNVTTTPPIELNNHQPFDIVYEQGVYQSIIVHDENPSQNPLTTINLDSLFKNLAIPAENRHVEVVQLQENGLATNVYEVKISDKSQVLEPITIADVHLSFPGGDGGLAVFSRNIVIDEGGGAMPPLEHFII